MFNLNRKEHSRPHSRFEKPERWTDIDGVNRATPLQTRESRRGGQFRFCSECGEKTPVAYKEFPQTVIHCNRCQPRPPNPRAVPQLKPLTPNSFLESNTRKRERRIT